jgi:hypothetical protein
MSVRLESFGSGIQGHDTSQVQVCRFTAECDWKQAGKELKRDDEWPPRQPTGNAKTGLAFTQRIVNKSILTGEEPGEEVPLMSALLWLVKKRKTNAGKLTCQISQDQNKLKKHTYTSYPTHHNIDKGYKNTNHAEMTLAPLIQSFGEARRI